MSTDFTPNSSNDSDTELHDPIAAASACLDEACDCASEGEPAADAQPPKADVNPLTAKLEAAEQEVKAAKDRYIRLLADFDNMRKRQARELSEMTQRANERLIKELLPIYDHLELALSNAPELEEAKAKAFLEGVQMIATQFHTALEQSGAKVIDALGQPFDPNLHEALQMIPDEQVPANHVAQQFRKGWKLGSQVIRPAQVIVSSGAPQAEGEGKK